MTKRFSIPIDLRFADLDLYGHVNSVVYFSYLETARVKLFRDVFQGLSDEGIFILVGSAVCEYRLPILIDDAVVVTVWVSRIGNASFDLEYRITDGAERTFATARTTLVCFDNVRKIAVTVPESLKNLA